MPDGPPYTALVVDDEPSGREAVRSLLEEEPAVRVVGEAANGDQAVALVRELAPDLLFLDVQMPGRDGFQVLEALGSDVPRGLVLVTAHDEHAVRAFEVHALDYVLKPFGRPRFRRAVERALRRMDAEAALSARHTLDAMLRGRREDAGSGREPGSLGPVDTHRSAGGPIGVRTGSRTVLVNPEDIDWVEADGDYVRLHEGTRTHLVSATMQAMEERLDPARFHRIHRSVIARLDGIRELHRDPDGGGSVVLRSDVRLRVARSRWESLETALGLGGGR